MTSSTTKLTYLYKVSKTDENKTKLDIKLATLSWLISIVVFRIPAPRGVSGYSLDSSNYCMFTHLLSFLGIEKEAALIIDEVQDYMRLV